MLPELMTRDSSESAKQIGCFSAPMCFATAMMRVMAMEARGQGAMLENEYAGRDDDGYDHFSIDGETFFLFMFVDIIIYFLLAVGAAAPFLSTLYFFL
jgi:hypothetical protein